MIPSLDGKKRCGNLDNKVTKAHIDAEYFCHYKRDNLDSTGHADHFNDEQPQPRDTTTEQCSCTSHVESTSSQMLISLLESKIPVIAIVVLKMAFVNRITQNTTTLVMFIS